jgi:predicted RNA-binding protein YlxR (DUF448 family)
MGKPHTRRAERGKGRSQAAASGQPAPPQTRTCVVCRARRPMSTLIRVARHDGAVTLGGASTGGRGAHVCIARDCLRGLSGRCLARAFRASELAPLDSSRVLRELHNLAQRRVLETIGLSRRIGILACGVDRLAVQPSAGDQSRQGSSMGIVLVASDAADRSRRRLKGAQPFVQAASIGQAAGQGPVGAVGIKPGRLAERAAYWLAVWYETHPPELDAAGGCQMAGGPCGTGHSHSGLIEVA